ncbi:MAG: YfhO family protein, partial [Lachnospiraceae bacterium]|nr:YfhO family protein [Lachnospiraceae bacterium]
MIRDRIKEAVVPAGITLIIFMGVLFAKGIFPFGGLRIDYYDMGQTNAPLYYHIWDFLHGREGLFYSWYIDEGQNLAMGSSIQWNISVFNLFFLFIKRSAVMKSLSLFIGLHLFFMAFNMDLLLRHTTGAPRFYRILFAMAYGLTGFTLTHYTIPAYLDTAALMPLYLITLYDVLTEGDTADASSDCVSGTGRKVCIKPVALYALMTGYMTGLGYYMAFMNLIFVLLVSGTYIFVLCGTGKTHNAFDKEERRRAVGRASAGLGIGTFAGLGLSSVMLLPAAMQMMKSSRFNSNLSGGFLETIHDILWAIGADMYYIKWWLLSGSIAAIVILLSGLIRFRKERRITVFFFLFCMYPCALIVFESINLLWHMGTYYHYPIRCGYLIPIVLLTTAAYYSGRIEIVNYVNQKEVGEDSVGSENIRGDLAKSENSGKEAQKKQWSYVNINRPAFCVLSIVSLVSCAGLIFYYTSHDTWQIEELFRAWVIFALILAAVYTVIWCVLKRPACIAPVLIMELAVTAYIGYGQPHFADKYSSDPEQSGDYVVASQALSDSLGIGESRTDRIKNPDTTLNTNYGFIMRRATVGGWANTVPRPQMDSAIALGYGAHFMRILDCGGTLLSDAALHVTETLTMKPDLYSEEAWEKRGEAEGYTLYDNKYTLPFIMEV